MDLLERHGLAPAKVNLSLHIVGRRADGYHLIDSLMVPVSLYDELHIRLASSTAPESTVRLTVESEHSDSVPNGPTNLASRAAAGFFATFRRRSVVAEIHLVKRIPVGSGLGGGSSDAATVLLTLNRMLGDPLSTADLCSLGTQIGADVPFFLYGSPARVAGVGEQVSPVRLHQPLHLVICWDGYALSTEAVYARVAAPSLTSTAAVSNIPAFVSGRQPASLVLVNDLETAAAQVYPKVLALKGKMIDAGATGALMTGSGSAVFGVWPDPQSAQRAAARLRAAGLWAEAVQTLDNSPTVSN